MLLCNYTILINTVALGLIVLQLTAPRSHTMAKRLFEVGDDLNDGASSAKPKSGQPLMLPLIEWKAREVTKGLAVQSLGLEHMGMG